MESSCSICSPFLDMHNISEGKKLEEERGSCSTTDTDSEGENLGEIIVPSTPKSKMKKKLEEKIRRDSEETVMQTPLSKLTRIPTRRSEKLAALLEKNEKNLSKRPRKKFSSPTLHTQIVKAVRGSLKPPPCTSGLTNGPRTRSARVNLRERFAAVDHISQDTVTSAAASSITTRNVLADVTLDKDLIDRYRKRIETVRYSARKSDKNEVFYGRCTSRRNLLDDSCVEEDEGVATRSTSCMQKNRSGRSVQTSRVYMAHALLNVYNTDPLNPPKLPKDAPFKLHRLIRPASKSDKKRLYKFRLRIAREKSVSSSVMAKSNTPSEGSEVASSSQSLKTKSESPERNLSNESGKDEIADTKEVSESGESFSFNTRKSADLFKEPSPRKSPRKCSKMSKNLENTFPYLNTLPNRIHYSDAGKLLNASNGLVSNAADSTSKSEITEKTKMSNEATNVLVETGESSSNYADSALEKCGSTGSPKSKLRRVITGIRDDKIESEGGELEENVIDLGDKIEGKLEGVNVP